VLQALLRGSIMGSTAFLGCLVIIPYLTGLPEEATLKACPPWARIVLCIVRTPALVGANKKYLETRVVNLCGRSDMHGFFAI